MARNNFVPQIPYGTKDFLPGEATRKRNMETRVAALFSRWGYEEVVTPTFEYWELFDSGMLTEQTFKFFDRTGSTLVLRPDMTTPIARLSATRLRESGRPKRLCYIANVFRHEQAQAGRQCEFYQAGVELLGAGSAAADAEMIALAAQTIGEAGLEDFKISVGHVDFLNGIIEKTGLPPAGKEKVRGLISGRDLAGLEAFLQEAGLPEGVQGALGEVMLLQGGGELLERAGLLADNPLSQKALDNLSEIYARLQDYGVADKVKFDLGLIRNLGYYTGMVFEAYTAGMGFPIAGGGRYDRMMLVFGDDCPATGFSVGIDRLLLVLGRNGNRERLEDVTYIGWAEGCFAKALAEADKLRSAGKGAEVALAACTQGEAKKAATGRPFIYADPC